MEELNEVLISIIMPVRDNERLFPNAVKSVLDQSFQDWELIIVEGRSTDNTAKLADDFAASDQRIRTFHIDEWMYESTNIGIYEAKGSYVAVLNSDDLLMPDALQRAAENIYAYDVDVYLFAVANFECDLQQNILSSEADDTIARMPKGFVIRDKAEIKKNWVNLLNTGLLNNQLNVYKKELVADERLRNDVFGADYYFNLTLLPKISSIAYVPQVSYRFNIYNTAGKLNTSVGKYYGYQHRMYNDFYFKAIEIFSVQNMLNKSVLKFIRNRRMSDFIQELDTYTFEHCKLSLEDRLFEIYNYAWDVKEIFEAENSYNLLEDGVFATTVMLLEKYPNEDAGKMKAIVEGCLELKKLKNNEYGSANKEAIDALIWDYYNPGHIGQGIAYNCK